jgi:histidine phosphotransfer protein HptB
MLWNATAPSSEQSFERFALFDAREFDALMDDVGVEIMALTLDTFVSETEARLERMRDGQMPQDLAREVHTLKGGAATFGATRLAEMARSIECAAMKGQPADSTQLRALEREFATVRGLLERRIEERPAVAA